MNFGLFSEILRFAEKLLEIVSSCLIASVVSRMCIFGSILVWLTGGISAPAGKLILHFSVAFSSFFHPRWSRRLRLRWIQGPTFPSQSRQITASDQDTRPILPRSLFSLNTHNPNTWDGTNERATRQRGSILLLSFQALACFLAF